MKRLELAGWELVSDRLSPTSECCLKQPENNPVGNLEVVRSRPSKVTISWVLFLGVWVGGGGGGGKTATTRLYPMGGYF